ncbi:hypothetical protein [Pengzhenrongella sicca]|uniref:Uncharacterized protein n=1 Tax=Pengzhenrongella sicca TaxID=2819238 RepID=A0A8A4Z8M4_9MICO|nr:hypothetical protein [Pengzhenrongella sicca]QTE28194.1 hypothetical protein J4E96_12420 [Pengzhenrongella sicca]
MTTTAMTTTAMTTALDELATAVAAAVETPVTRAALAVIVLDLEGAAGARLGAVADDAWVMLARRFARAHRLLLCGPHELSAAAVRASARTLGAGAGAEAAQPARPAQLDPYGRGAAPARPRISASASSS